jgi:hypothetical protein
MHGGDVEPLIAPGRQPHLSRRDRFATAQPALENLTAS